MKTISGFEIDRRLDKHPFADAGIVYAHYSITNDIEHRMIRLISGKEGKPIACILMMDNYKDQHASDRIFYIAPNLSRGELRHVCEFAGMYGISYSIVHDVVTTNKVYSLKHKCLMGG